VWLLGHMTKPFVHMLFWLLDEDDENDDSKENMDVEEEDQVFILTADHCLL